MATTGFVPRIKIPSRLLIERPQATPIPSNLQEDAEAITPGAKPTEDSSLGVETVENRSRRATRAMSKASNVPAAGDGEQGTKQSLKDSPPKKTTGKRPQVEVVIESKINLSGEEFDEDSRVDIRLVPKLFGKV